MKFKLDENLGPSIQSQFAEAGYDCHTVREEGLQGSPDSHLFSMSVAEGRVFVTLDGDFGNVLRYPPEGTPGIVVLTPSGRLSPAGLRSLVHGLLTTLRQRAGSVGDYRS